MWVAALLLGVLIFWFWFFAGSRAHCPNCGVELPDDFAYPGQKAGHCACGWRAE